MKKGDLHYYRNAGVEPPKKSPVARAVQAVKEITWNVTEPMKAKKADAARAALKLNAETKHIRPDASTKFGQDVLMARASVARTKREVEKRRK